MNEERFTLNITIDQRKEDFKEWLKEEIINYNKVFELYIYEFVYIDNKRKLVKNYVFVEDEEIITEYTAEKTIRRNFFDLPVIKQEEIVLKIFGIE